ncbi:ABC transporter ATP-binding protein/permease [Candidatus Dependentiae bacterium]|nr:ABC transporter ATP-binding protein/permease [Candidatus Dependentiae bacterium]
MTSLFFSFFSLILQDKKLIIKTGISFFLTILGSLLTMSLPLVLSEIVRQLSTPKTDVSLLSLVLLVGYGLLWIATQALGQIRSLIMVHVTESTIAQISLRVFEHLHALSLRFHLDRKTGALFTALDRAQTGCETVMWSFLFFLLPVCFEFACTMLILFYYYGLLHCLGLLILFALFVVINYFMMSKINTAQATYNEKRGQAGATMLDSLINIETSKYFANQHADYQQCKALFEEQKQAGILRQVIETWLSLSQVFIIGSAFVIVTFITGKRVLNGSSSLAEFVLINGYFLQFIMPLQHVVYAFGQVRKGLQDVVQIHDLLQEEPEIKDAPDAKVLSPKEVEIIFKNVSFGYSAERPILKNISFTVAPGKTVALVGPSGSGKSTIIKLLFRLFDVNDGAILINGQDIRNVAQDSIKNLISIVPQDVVLFNNTIRYNIAYGNIAATQQEIEQAAQQAQIDQLIQKLPSGYDTLVGERGLKLSGGEKQRVGIARALLKKPLINVFDEATSSLDSYTEHEIQKNILALSFDVTTLIVAHRLSTVSHADEILVLDQGEIVEHGTHDELLSSCGLYQKLWQEQMINFC